MPSASSGLLAAILLLARPAACLSSKKGLGVSRRTFQCGDLEAFNGVSWFYNWGTDNVMAGCQESLPAGLEFIPMIWGYWGHPESLPDLSQHSTVLGFNEPNHHSQANMQPEQAATAWMDLQAAYPDQVLVSPCASDPNTTIWFEQFFSACEQLGCRIDYLATHSYHGNAAHDIQFIEELYQRFGRRVWFTEFARPRTKDPDKELQFMQDILPLLEESEAVAAYAWFVTRKPEPGGGEGWWLDGPAISLLEQNSSTLTKLGRYYDQF